MIGPAWDSLLAKLIVTGATREQALQRAARALAEFTGRGHGDRDPVPPRGGRRPGVRAELDGSDEPFTVHTRWIETEFDNTIPPFAGAAVGEDEDADDGRETVVVEVGGKRLEVSLPGVAGHGAGPDRPRPRGAKPKRRGRQEGRRRRRPVTRSPRPMQGTIVKVAVEEGQEVAEGDLIVVLEAMKMEQPLNAHRSGTVKGLAAEVGASVTSGAVDLRDQGLTSDPSRAPADLGRGPRRFRLTVGERRAKGR